MSAMRTSAVPTADADLIRLVREGDADAYGLLYERHVGAATALARQISRNDADADDLVADAFARVLVAISNGNGPTDAFRPYLLTAVRRRAYDRTDRAAREELVQEPAEDRTFAELVADLAETDHVDRDLATTAFLTLPERWQAVLWHLEVEGATPAEAGEILGLNANATSVLAHRAREGLRQAFLQAHLQDAPDDGCAFTLERLGAYVRDGLAKRATQKVHDHLEVCARCTGLRGELSDLNTTLRRTVAPAILGPAAAGYFLARRGASAEAATSATTQAGSHELAKTVGTIAASAAAVVLLGAAVFQINRDDPTAADQAASPATELVADDRADDRADASTPVDAEGEGEGGPEEAPLPDAALPGVALLCGEAIDAGAVQLPADTAGEVTGAALVWNDEATARSGLDLPATTQLVTDAVDGTLAGAFSFVTDVTTSVQDGACGVATLVERLPEAGIGQWVLVLTTDVVADVVDAAIDLVEGTVDQADAVVEGLTGLTVTDTLADGVLQPAVAAVARAAAALEALGAGGTAPPGTGSSGAAGGTSGSDGSGGSGSSGGSGGSGGGGTGGTAPTTPTVPDSGGPLGPILDPLLPGNGGGGGQGGETCGLLGQLLGTC